MSPGQLVVEQFKYDPEQKEESRSFFNLLRGGLRAVTGLIAGVNPSQVKYKTVNATIGVRGTGFDIICDGKCEPTTGSKSMQVNVWDGSIVIQQPDIETVVTSGHSASINSPFNKPSVSPSNSREMQKIPSRPDQMKIDFDALFGATEMSETAPEEGLYVGVYEGHVNVENDLGQSVDIGAGEAAFSGVSGSVVIPIGTGTHDPRTTDVNRQDSGRRDAGKILRDKWLKSSSCCRSWHKFKTASISTRSLLSSIMNTSA